MQSQYGQNGGKESYSPEGLWYNIQAKLKQKETPKEEKIHKIVAKISPLQNKGQIHKEIQKLQYKDLSDAESPYYSSLQQSLISHLPYEIIMDAIRKLELKVEKLTNKFDNFTKGNEKKHESCVVYYHTLVEKDKIFSYLQNRGISFQPIGGAILTNQRVVEILKEGSFKFGVAKNTKELYEKEPNLIKNLAKQVRKHYNLPGRTK